MPTFDTKYYKEVEIETGKWHALKDVAKKLRPGLEYLVYDQYGQQSFVSVLEPGTQNGEQWINEGYHWTGFDVYKWDPENQWVMLIPEWPNP